MANRVVFTAGSPVTAANLNTLSLQGWPVYASTAARDSDNTAATVGTMAWVNNAGLTLYMVTSTGPIVWTVKGSFTFSTLDGTFYQSR